MWRSLIAIALGAVAGAWLRWTFDVALNALFPTIPPGTLVANLIGAFVIGVALQVFASSPALSPEWRLLIVTGFCGGLTTFSTFSAELVTLLQAGRLAWAAGHIGIHVAGSVLCTLLGIYTAVAVRAAAT
ncbi:MAG TPA: fluoride efflux transporter CrcB [Steroidobacter sp.]